jgi:phosphatidylserine/phosphatidylglycerophosphate/cardiolipin synthase-like enzyme
MHNKFAIIDQKVWTGSFNWTHSANHKNHENVVIIGGEDSIRLKFLKQFDALKGYCAQAQYPKKNAENKLSSKAIQMQIYDFLKDIKFRFGKQYVEPLAFSKPRLKLRNSRGRQVKNKQKQG